MRLIQPPQNTEGMLLTSEEVYQGPVVSELGVLGTCLWRREVKEGNDKIDLIKNETVGWTFKTKPLGVDEMNVVKGYGCFDCPLMVDDL